MDVDVKCYGSFYNCTQAQCTAFLDLCIDKSPDQITKLAAFFENITDSEFAIVIATAYPNIHPGTALNIIDGFEFKAIEQVVHGQKTKVYETFESWISRLESSSVFNKQLVNKLRHNEKFKLYVRTLLRILNESNGLNPNQNAAASIKSASNDADAKKKRSSASGTRIVKILGTQDDDDSDELGSARDYKTNAIMSSQYMTALLSTLSRMSPAVGVPPFMFGGTRAIKHIDQHGGEMKMKELFTMIDRLVADISKIGKRLSDNDIRAITLLKNAMTNSYANAIEIGKTLRKYRSVLSAHPDLVDNGEVTLADISDLNIKYQNEIKTQITSQKRLAQAGLSIARLLMGGI
jgi:hypothetical protein